MSAATPRWTPSRIRKAMPFPKPTTELSRIEKALYAASTGVDWIVRHIARHADLIHDGKSLNDERDFTVDRVGVLPAYWPASPLDFAHHGDWLLVPVSPQIIEALAEIGAATEDFETTGDDEPDINDEPSLGSLDGKSSQVNWGGGDTSDVELDAADLEDLDEREPEDAGGLVWAPDWNTQIFPPSESTAKARRPRLPVTAAAD